MIWTGSKRVGKKDFADENGNLVQIFCNILHFAQIDKHGTIRRRELYFEFPTEMTATFIHGNSTKHKKDISWKNTIPGKSNTKLEIISINNTDTLKDNIQLVIVFAIRR